ncbi:MAG TPA: beta-1,3-glucanase family protein, partial [Lacipirellulaceae bacterium]|nr:beta-1,3-glucanase family protein [Lacipirellulaceae bacterium]
MNQLFRLLLAAIALVICAGPARAIHLSFTNNSAFPTDQVYVWFGGAAEAGYDLKIAGQSQNVTLGQSYSLTVLASGAALNRLVAGRVYISFGVPLPDPGRTPHGSPIRYPGVSPGDDGYTTRWDFLELTHTNSPADVADLTSMDGFSIPLTIQLKHQGATLTGPNTSAGWKGHTDADVLNYLKPLARPVAANVFTSGDQFVRVKGANSFPTLYQNQPGDAKSMAAYLASIKAAGRVTTLDGVAFGMNYEYAAALDADGNYVLNRTGGNPATPHTILIPASYKAGPNPADPIVT